MQMSYIISQLLVILAYVLMGFGFLKKDKISILIHSEIFNALMLIQYLLLHGIMGIVACIVNIIRNSIFIRNEKLSKKNNIILLFIFSFLSVLCTAVFYKSIFDIIPCILAILSSYAYWCSSTKILRVINLLCSMCYIAYAISLKSYVTIICELYLISSIVLGYFKNDFKKKKSI